MLLLLFAIERATTYIGTKTNFNYMSSRRTNLYTFDTSITSTILVYTTTNNYYNIYYFQVTAAVNDH